MREMVTWESIVGKDFLPLFTQIATAEYWATVKDLPIKTVYDRFSDEDVQKYRDKRAQMRAHGWSKSFLSRRNELKFGIMLRQGEAPEITYITLSDFISKRQADNLQRYADEWDDKQDAIRKVARHFHIDEDFVREEAL